MKELEVKTLLKDNNSVSGVKGFPSILCWICEES